MGALFGLFFTSAVIALSGAMMPGPLLSVAVSESYKRGFRAGPLLIAGHLVPEMLLAVLFSFGLNRFLDNKNVTGVVGVVGGVFLFWLSIKIFLEVRRGIFIDLTSKKEVIWGPVVAGLWGSVSNPGWVIWWATIGAKYILLSLEQGIAGLIFFFAGHATGDLVWYSVVSFVVSRGRGRINEKIYVVVLYVCALLVAAFAVYFIISGSLTLSAAS
ncbi:MAG: LysE family transporter [Actinobacteria bacterium]|nr:LysE family transporter [Actinomycetota bacterium]